MATVSYTLNSYQVDMVAFTGTNIDEIVAFVGAENVRVEGDRVEVWGEQIAVGDRVALKHADGTKHGRVTASKLAVNYTAV